MEHTADNSIDRLVNNYINNINKNNIFSESDVAEIADYLLSEIECLVEAGLNTEEAFTIAKMRYGRPTEVVAEYHKVKPYHKLLQILKYTIVFLTFFKILTLVNRASIIAFWSTIGSKMNVDYIFIINAGIQILVTLILIFIITRTSSKAYIQNTMQKWYFPLFYLAAILLDRAFYFFQVGIRVHLIPDVSIYSNLFYAQSLLSFLTWIGVSCYVMYHMYKDSRKIKYS